LQRVRDEAHRFANARREKRLDLTMTRSKLDEVPGIGDLTKKSLLKRFGSADAVIEAADTDLIAILTQSQLQELRKRFPRQIS
jgi:excinuclease ABC subunit C